MNDRAETLRIRQVNVLGCAVCTLKVQQYKTVVLRAEKSFTSRISRIARIIILQRICSLSLLV